MPFAPGGNADIVGRLVGDQISKGDRPASGGREPRRRRRQPSARHSSRAPTPDGYTLLVGSNGPLTVNPFVQAHLDYDPLKDFAPVALTSYVPHAIILNQHRRRPRRCRS